MLRWLCDSSWTGCAWRTTPYIHVARTSNNRVIVACNLWWYKRCQRLKVTIAYAKSDLGLWTLLLLAATVRSIAHMPLGISDRNNSSRVWPHSFKSPIPIIRTWCYSSKIFAHVEAPQRCFQSSPAFAKAGLGWHVWICITSTNIDCSTCVGAVANDTYVWQYVNTWIFVWRYITLICHFVESQSRNRDDYLQVLSELFNVVLDKAKLIWFW